MSTRDFGAVPVSRLKDEATRIFAALDQGRKVLISRHGLVIAAIAPASVQQHAYALARFAVSDTAGLDEMTATEFSQGSPSGYIRKAEAGAESATSPATTRCMASSRP